MRSKSLSGFNPKVFKKFPDKFVETQYLDDKESFLNPKIDDGTH